MFWVPDFLEGGGIASYITYAINVYEFLFVWYWRLGFDLSQYRKGTRSYYIKMVGYSILSGIDGNRQLLTYHQMKKCFETFVCYRKIFRAWRGGGCVILLRQH